MFFASKMPLSIVLAWQKETGFRILAWHKQDGTSMSTVTSLQSALVFRLLSDLDMVIQPIFENHFLYCFIGNGFRHTLIINIHIYILCQMKISCGVLKKTFVGKKQLQDSNYKINYFSNSMKIKLYSHCGPFQIHSILSNYPVLALPKSNCQASKPVN